MTDYDKIQKIKKLIFKLSKQFNSDTLTYSTHCWFGWPSESLKIKDIELNQNPEFGFFGWDKGIGEKDLIELEHLGVINKIKEYKDEQDPLEKIIEYQINLFSLNSEINSFYWIAEFDLKIKLNLGIKTTLFDGNSSSTIDQYYNSNSNGIAWDINDNLIKIFEPNNRISGFPNHLMNKIIAIFPIDHINYPMPKNSIIYNSNGTIHKQLNCPPLISDLAMIRKSRLNYSQPGLLHFESVKWAINSKGETVTAISIAYDRDYYETRELNTETGEFGERLSSGMR